MVNIMMHQICYLLKHAIIDTDDFDKGKILINPQNQDINDHSIGFINSVIDFYGERGDVNNALTTFHNIAENKRDVVTNTAFG